jgi:hypothetical protein
MKNRKQRGEAGTAVVVILVAALLSWIHTATGGDKKGDKGITVRPAEEQKR